jgi:hypothetical protein
MRRIACAKDSKNQKTLLKDHDKEIIDINLSQSRKFGQEIRLI